MSGAGTYPEWQPIETAPKDKRIIAWNGNLVTEALWLDDTDDNGHVGWCGAGFTDGGMLYYHHNELEPKPTKWMPLPDGPK